MKLKVHARVRAGQRFGDEDFAERVKARIEAGHYKEIMDFDDPLTRMYHVRCEGRLVKVIICRKTNDVITLFVEKGFKKRYRKGEFPRYYYLLEEGRENKKQRNRRLKKK